MNQLSVKAMCRQFFTRAESGQSTIEATLLVGLLFLCTLFAINFAYYMGFINTIHSSGAIAAQFSTQGNLTANGTLPAASTVSQAATNETYNTTNANTQEAAAGVVVCTAAAGSSNGAGNCTSGMSSFSDPEASTSNTGNFSANAVQVTQTFTPAVSGSSIFGFNVMPFSTPHSVTHTVYMRALNQ
jgi:Flp pilus assembly protein TadG